MRVTALSQAVCPTFTQHLHVGNAVLKVVPSSCVSEFFDQDRNSNEIPARSSCDAPCWPGPEAQFIQRPSCTVAGSFFLTNQFLQATAKTYDRNCNYYAQTHIHPLCKNIPKMTTISVSNEIDGAIVFEGDLREDASSSSPSSAISLEVSGFVYFEELLASIEPQPSAGPTSTTTTAANNNPLEGDNAPTDNNERDASIIKSIFAWITTSPRANFVAERSHHNQVVASTRT